MKKITNTQALNNVKNYISKNCETLDCDWDDLESYKSMICYNYKSKCFFQSTTQYLQCTNVLPWLKYEDANKVIDNCEEDLKIILNIKQ